tara:strand:- start:2019 stop:2966 length:948 start_codon:yes stop_codon:yes gene_type:complete
MLKTLFLPKNSNLYKFTLNLNFLILIFLAFDLTSDTRLIILGSGTPNPDPERSGSAYAVIANDKAYLFDFGPGVVRRISSMSETWGGQFEQMELKNITVAFLTHIHSDHSSGLADLILTPWVMGRSEPLELYGPIGLKNMSQNITNAYIDDINYRLYGSQPANNQGYLTEVVEIVNDGLIFQDKNISVTAFKNNHGGFQNSYGYLIESDDKRILISGDTSISKNLIKLGKNLDILVHEVYSSETFKNKTDDWKKYHSEHHTSSIDLGIIANKINPKKLVLSHILYWGATDDSLILDVRKNFDGNIIVAKDLMIVD